MGSNVKSLSFFRFCIFSFLLASCLIAPLSARDVRQPWDLDRASKNVEDYPVSNPFLLIESSEHRYRHRILGFHHWVDYPEYSGVSFYPLFSSRYASNDQKKHWFFPLYFYEKVIISSPPEEGNLVQNQFISPIAFYNSGPDNYTTLIPIIPLLYIDDVSEEGSFTSLSVLVQWTRKKTDLESLWIQGLAYYGQSEESEYLHILPPIYSSVRQPTWSYELFLPLYFEAKSREGRFYANLLGYTKQSASVSLGSNGKSDYLDVDTGYLYGIFSLSHRFAVTRNEQPNTSDNLFQEAQFQITETPGRTDASLNTRDVAIRNSDPLDRETAVHFHSWKALWGLLAYTEADEWRHFRFLPLSYLSWHTRSEDQILLLPPVAPIFAHYRDGADGYTALFPLYGSQSSQTSERTVIPALLAYRSRDLKDHSVYTTALWPIIHHSTDQNSRTTVVLPLYADIATTKEIQKTRTTFSPLHYFSRTEQEGNLQSETLVYPLQISHASGTETRTDFHPFPLILATRDREEKDVYLPAFLSYFHSSPAYDLELGILGTVWFRFRDDHTDRKMLLMGTLYNAKQTRDATSQGSMWGLLWEQGSDDKGTHFSLGKYLVQYRSTAEDTEFRILGVPLI